MRPVHVRGSDALGVAGGVAGGVATLATRKTGFKRRGVATLATSATRGAGPE